MIKNKNDLYGSKNFQKLLNLNGFIKIPFSLAVWYDLTPAECFIYVYIDNATNHLKNNSFTDTETTLQALCNSSKSTVHRSLKNLIQKGLIEKTREKDESGKKIVIYKSLKPVASQFKIKVIKQH